MTHSVSFRLKFRLLTSARLIGRAPSPRFIRAVAVFVPSARHHRDPRATADTQQRRMHFRWRSDPDGRRHLSADRGPVRSGGRGVTGEIACAGVTHAHTGAAELFNTLGRDGGMLLALGAEPGGGL